MDGDEAGHSACPIDAMLVERVAVRPFCPSGAGHACRPTNAASSPLATRTILAASSMTSARRHSSLGPRGIDIFVGRNKGVNLGENVLMEPPLSLGQVDAVSGDNRALLDFVESGDRCRPFFTQCGDPVIVHAHANPHTLRQAFCTTGVRRGGLSIRFAS